VKSRIKNENGKIGYYAPCGCHHPQGAGMWETSPLMSTIEVWRHLPQFKGAAGSGFECYNPNVDYYKFIVRESLEPR